jgi:acetyl-CoA synthetase
VPLRPITTLDEYRAAHARSLADPDGFWAEEAQVLEWFHPFAQVLDADLDEVDFSWFGHGRLNAAYNCVDRHARTTPDKVAIIWVGNEPGEGKDLTYRELKHRSAASPTCSRRTACARAIGCASTCR